MVKDANKWINKKLKKFLTYFKVYYYNKIKYCIVKIQQGGKRMKRLLAVGLVMATTIMGLRVMDVSAEAFANVGFSAEAMGRGDAVIASVNDASANWYNPARLAFLDTGHNLQLNVDGVYLFHKATPESTNIYNTQSYKNETGLQFLGAIFYSYRPANFMDGKLAFGIGYNSPYGLKTEFNREAAVASIAYVAKVYTRLINPNIAYRINDSLAVSLGGVFMNTHASLRTSWDRIMGSGDFNLDFGWTWATGINSSVAWKINENQNLGFTFRSQLKAIFDDGTVTRDLPVAPFVETKVTTNLSFPDQYGIGWSIQLNEKALLELDGLWRNWNDYDYIPYNSSITKGLGVKNYWRNGGIASIGWKYDVSDFWGYTTGYQYHFDPETEYYAVAMMPDSVQHAISGGLNFNFGSLIVSPAFLYGSNFVKNINAPGRVSGAGASIDGENDIQVYHFSLGTTYKF